MKWLHKTAGHRKQNEQMDKEQINKQELQQKYPFWKGQRQNS